MEELKLTSEPTSDKDVLNLKTNEGDEVIAKVNTKALKNLHILGAVYACISAGLLVADLAAVVVVVLTAYVFSVLSVTVAMNVLIILGILAVVFLVCVIVGAIVSGVAKRKMIKGDVNSKTSGVDDKKEEEKNSVKEVDFSGTLKFLKEKGIKIEGKEIERNKLLEFLYKRYLDKNKTEKETKELYNKMVEDLKNHCKKGGTQNVVSALFSEIKEFWNDKSKEYFKEGVFGWDGKNESLKLSDYLDLKVQNDDEKLERIKYFWYFKVQRFELKDFLKNFFQFTLELSYKKDKNFILVFEEMSFFVEEISSFVSADISANEIESLNLYVEEGIKEFFEKLEKFKKSDLVKNLENSKIKMLKKKVNNFFNKIEKFYSK